MVLLTRKIEFSASHRYNNPALSAEENQRIFGKCNNPHGHGHNYTLEVTVAGEPDPVTGMVVDLADLKKILEQEVMRRMDHRHLNFEVPELAGQIPTFLLAPLAGRANEDAQIIVGMRVTRNWVPDQYGCDPGGW